MQSRKVLPPAVRAKLTSLFNENNRLVDHGGAKDVLTRLEEVGLHTYVDGSIISKEGLARWWSNKYSRMRAPTEEDKGTFGEKEDAAGNGNEREEAVGMQEARAEAAGNKKGREEAVGMQEDADNGDEEDAEEESEDSEEDSKDPGDVEDADNPKKPTTRRQKKQSSRASKRLRANDHLLTVADRFRKLGDSCILVSRSSDSSAKHFAFSGIFEYDTEFQKQLNVLINKSVKTYYRKVQSGKLK